MGSLYGTPVSARSSVAQIRRFGAARPAMLVDGTGAHNGSARAALDGADYATRREPSRLREPIAHHVNIREAAPEALSTLSLPIQPDRGARDYGRDLANSVGVKSVRRDQRAAEVR